VITSVIAGYPFAGSRVRYSDDIVRWVVVYIKGVLGRLVGAKGLLHVVCR